MPGMDKTGPFGTGSMGRGLGPCGGGQAGRGRGRGFSRRGNGWGMGQAAAPITEEKAVLEQRKNWLENQLDEINQYLKEMEEK